MIPSFPRIYHAIEITIEYFNIGRIKDHFYKLQGHPNLDYLDNRIATTKSWHLYMKEEINQNVVGAKPFVVREMFDYLNYVVSTWRFQPDIADHISQLIIEENEKIILEYTKQIGIDELKFRTKVDFLKPHEPPTKETQYDFRYEKGQTKIEIIEPNSWFYENNRKTNILEDVYFSKYLEIVKDIIASFREVVDPYLDRYNTGRVEGLGLQPIQENIVQQLPASSVLPKVQEGNKKLKVNLTVEQLTVLFRLLKDCKLTNAKLDKEIHAFIADNFETLGLEGKKASIKNIGKLFSSTDPDVMNFWIARFKDLSKKAENK